MRCAPPVNVAFCVALPSHCCKFPRMLPPLYKFREVNDYTLDSLREGYLYFSHVRAFNDPFEFRPYLSHDTGAKSLRRHVEAHVRRINPGLPYLERARFVTEILKGGNLREVMNRRRYFPEEKVKEVAVLCLSANRGSILQWSHYARNHEGICVELDVNNDELLRSSLPINYSEKYPEIDFWSNPPHEEIERAMLTKSVDWSYEAEYRAMTQTAEGKCKYGVSPGDFVSITFGARISAKDREAVIEATRVRLSHIRFEEARLAERTFNLEFEKYPVGN